VLESGEAVSEDGEVVPAVKFVEGPVTYYATTVKEDE
jgi:hypothetical protein